MSKSFTQRLGSPVIMDGGLGSELELRGINVPRAPWWTAWNNKHTPEAVKQVHADYAAAGATVHTTNTFRTKRINIGDEWEALATRAYQLCRDAIPLTHKVAGSISPVGHCYDTRSGAIDASVYHRELAHLLADLGTDILLCETFAALEEAFEAIDICVKTGVPTWAAFTSGPQNDLLTPQAFRSAARQAIDLGAEAVLINCTPAISVLPYIEAINDLSVPLGAFANGGSMQDGIGWNAGDDGVDVYAALAQRWVEAGASIVGGCCGIRPPHIRRLAEKLTPNKALQVKIAANSKPSAITEACTEPL